MNFTVDINGIEVDAYYSNESIEQIFLPLLRQLTALQREKKKRILVMLAAPPGAGKSTLCEFLTRLVEQDKSLENIKIIGMDGFHRYQDYLVSHTTIRDGKEIPMVQIKGAPITFDLPLLKERIAKVAAGEVCGWPTYNRMTHNPTEDAITVEGDIVLLEGNYLLLDHGGWEELSTYADYTIRIIASEDDLRARLVERKHKSGASMEEAIAFVEYSDLYNARLCLEHSKEADLTLYLDSDGSYYIEKSEHIG